MYTEGVWCATGRRDRDHTTTTKDSYSHVPCEFSAAGLMVPEGSMMPFPITPFDKGATCCSEYIPGVCRVAEVQGSSVHVSELQPRPVLGVQLERAGGGRGCKGDEHEGGSGAVRACGGDGWWWDWDWCSPGCGADGACAFPLRGHRPSATAYLGEAGRRAATTSRLSTTKPGGGGGADRWRRRDGLEEK